MKLLINLALISVLGACSSAVVPAPSIDVRELIVKADSPRSINTKPVEFKVITDQSTDIFETDRVLYAINIGSYEALSFNVQEMLRYIRDQKAVIRYYEGLITEK